MMTFSASGGMVLHVIYYLDILIEKLSRKIVTGRSVVEDVLVLLNRR